MEILLVLLGIVIGAGIALLVARSKFSTDTQKMASSILIEQDRNRTLDDQLRELKRDLETERKKVLDTNNSLASAEADYRNIQEKLQDQKKELENLNEKFTAQFKNLANDNFEEKTKKFTDQNK